MTSDERKSGSGLKKLIILGTIGAAVYFSGKYTGEYVAITKANTTIDSIAREKESMYGHIKNIDEMLPLVREELKQRYIADKEALQAKNIIYDKQFLDAVKAKQESQDKAKYSWAAFFMK